MTEQWSSRCRRKFDFVFRKWAEEVKQDPWLAGQQPYKAIIEKDMAVLGGVAVRTRRWSAPC